MAGSCMFVSFLPSALGFFPFQTKSSCSLCFCREGAEGRGKGQERAREGREEERGSGGKAASASECAVQQQDGVFGFQRVTPTVREAGQPV